MAKATAAGFNGYATAAEPCVQVGVVCVVRVVGVVDFVFVGVVGVVDVAVITFQSLFVWFSVAEVPRYISTCDLQGVVALEGVSSAREQPEGHFDMQFAGFRGSGGRFVCTRAPRGPFRPVIYRVLWPWGGDICSRLGLG